MTRDVAWQRFYQQGLIQPHFATATEVVAALGAVQAQDYFGAKWALAQRMRGEVNDQEIEAAFNRGELLRTHVMRPTWHFVAPADIRWLQKLTAPRVHVTNNYHYRDLGLDASTLHKGHAIFVRALEQEEFLTRDELSARLAAEDFVAEGRRLAYLIMHAELEAVICSGPRRGKQFTYALLDVRVPSTPTLDHDTALAELVKRYFTSHGPALLKDFTWWSGLTTTDTKRAIEMLGDQLVQESIKGQTYWSAPLAPATFGASSVGYLLPNYDEAVASYKEYSASLAPEFHDKWRAGERLFPHFLIINGQIIGTWRRTLSARAVHVETMLFVELTSDKRRAMIAAAERYAAFLGLALELDGALTDA